MPPLPAIPLARGVTDLPPGAWRIAFLPEREALEPEQRAAPTASEPRCKTGTSGRICWVSEASRGEDVSTFRRTALARARAVKAALVAGGLDETRIDIRSVTRGTPPSDRVDVLTPTAPRN